MRTVQPGDGQVETLHIQSGAVVRQTVSPVLDFVQVVTDRLGYRKV